MTNTDVWGTVIEYNGKGFGVIKPDDPIHGNILISEKALHAGGHTEPLKKGDRVKIEILTYAFRVFEIIPK